MCANCCHINMNFIAFTNYLGFGFTLCHIWMLVVFNSKVFYLIIHYYIRSDTLSIVGFTHRWEIQQ